jgi:outer membrane receptor protein involved in Fe transport
VTAGLRYDYFLSQYQDVLKDNRVDKAHAGIWSPKLSGWYQVHSRLQLYLSAGKGFHSNDTRVAAPQNGLPVLPAAFGTDIGTIVKPAKNLLIHTALWYLWLEQEFIYVGDEGIVEPSGTSRRMGVDVSARYQPVTWLLVEADWNYARPRSVEAAKGEDYLPLAPLLTSAGGITVKTKPGLQGSLRYRYMGDRPANEDYSVTAKGYFVIDALVNYTAQKVAIGISVQNLMNARWKETQFETESRLFHEVVPVSEIHFTPGTPLALKASFTYSL